MKTYHTILLGSALSFTTLLSVHAAPKPSAPPQVQAKKVAAKKAVASKKVVAAAAPKANGVRFGSVQIAGVSVKGLTPEEAKRRLARVLKPKLQTRLKLTDGKHAAYRTRGQIGIALDLETMLQVAEMGRGSVPLKFRATPIVVQKALRPLSKTFDFAGRDAKIVEVGSRIKIVPDQAARHLDVGTSAVRIAQQIKKNPGVRVLELVSKTTPRKITAAHFKGIDARIGSFTTNYNAAKVKRTLNMRIAIKAIDGTILKPNETFSLNKAVGERTQARGYRTSIIFQNGYKVPGVGAGVSQVTGTLFNAALLAGLPIEEVKFHSRPVAYLPIGRDATVAWGGFDMKFKNNTSAPIYIKYSISNSSVSVALFGKKTPGQTVSLIVHKQQKGPRLITAQLYRTIRRNGKVVNKQLIRNHTYKWNVGAWEE